MFTTFQLFVIKIHFFHQILILINIFKTATFGQTKQNQVWRNKVGRLLHVRLLLLLLLLVEQLLSAEGGGQRGRSLITGGGARSQGEEPDHRGRSLITGGGAWAPPVVHLCTYLEDTREQTGCYLQASSSSVIKTGCSWAAVGPDPAVGR